MSEPKFECSECHEDCRDLHLVTVDAPDNPSGKDKVLKCGCCMSIDEMNSCPYAITEEMWGAVSVDGDWFIVPPGSKKSGNSCINFGFLYGKDKANVCMTPKERIANLKKQGNNVESALSDAQSRARRGSSAENKLAWAIPRTGGGYTVIQFEALEDGFRVSLVDTEGHDPWGAAKQVMHEWTGSEYALEMEEPKR